MAKITEKTIRDIVDKRKRMSTPDRAASWRMSSLLQTFNYPLKHRDELLRYFPIAVVAAIDGYFRTRLSQLIDSGEPFLSNAVNSYPNVTLDTPLAVAIASKRVSLGELLMHSMTINSFEALVQIVNRITGFSNFLDEIAKIKPMHLDAKDNERIVRDPAVTWKYLGRVFGTRHILCHELAADLELDETEIRGLLITSQHFMTASAAWLEMLEHPNPPLTRQQRMDAANKTFRRAKKRLDAKLKLFEHAPAIPRDTQLKVIQAAQDLEAYFDALEEATTALYPTPDFPLIMEDQVVIEHAQALNKLTSRLNVLAMFAGLETHRDSDGE